jgi:hypothetical protein
MGRKAPHDVPFGVVVLVVVCGIVFIIEGTGEHEATVGAEYQRRAVQNWWRCRSSHVIAEVELSGNGDDSGLDASCVWDELQAQRRARAISTDQHVTGCGRSVLEAGGNGTLRVAREGNALLAVVNNLAEPLAEN